jgi:hypothetical protein
VRFASFNPQWTDSGTKSKADSTVTKVADVLDNQFLHLFSVLLVCSQSLQDHAYRRPLLLSDAECFKKVFAAHCEARGLRTFRFYARDGFANWTHWGQEEETVSYTDDYTPLF